MKIVVISDSHGNVANLKNVCGFAKNINAGSIIHCGDWNTVSAIETVLAFGLPLYCVLGNADIDPGVSDKLSGRSDPPASAVLKALRAGKFEKEFLSFELANKRIGVVHKIQDAIFANQDVIFYGHTHVQLDSKKSGVKIVNPGALENTISFAVYDTTSGKVEFIKEFENTISF